MAKTNWHTMKIAEVLADVGGLKNGLSSEEAEARLEKYGYNVLPEERPAGAVSIFLRQLYSPLVSILLVAAIITAVLRDFIDMGVILAAVVINAIIGFWQEWQADKAFLTLKQMVKHRARARRDNREVELDASEVVPGDIILLCAGDHVPADARLLLTFDFETNEALLTGESLPVKKHTKILPAATIMAERANMVFQGTTVARGKAEAVVVSTGKETSFGEIAILVHKIKDPETPLQSRFRNLSKLLGAMVMLVAIAVFILGVFQGRPLGDMFLMAVALAVAAIPEGLSISLTVILAIGMRNLAKHSAIVKNLLAAETLGSVSVICTDKTGTLTTGKMEVVEVIGDKEKSWEIAVAGNSANSPTSAALINGAEKAGYDLSKINRSLVKIDEIPFDSNRKWSATLHRGRERNVLNVCGAPEKLLEIAKLTASEKKYWLDKIDAMTAQGKRLVAAVYLELPREQKKISDIAPDYILPNNFVFAGILALQDPLRPHIQEVVAETVAAGIRTVIMTGDHANTAMAIGAEAGLFLPSPSPSIPLPGGEERRSQGEGCVLTGAEMDALDDEALEQKVKTVNIFARVLPKHKVRVVDAFHRLGLSVAMTGDGINDAPALKAADIGVAVESGTDAAKEAADVVLLDNNFKTIVSAVRGGRIIYQNVKKVVAYLLSNSWAEIVLVLGSIVMGLPLPVVPAQILWVNFIDHSLSNMAIAFDKDESDVMIEKPRSRNEPLMDTQMKVLVFGAGFIMSVFLLILYVCLRAYSDDLMYIRTMMFAALGIHSMFYIYSLRCLKKHLWQTNLFGNRLMVGSTILSILLMIIAVYIPFLQHILRTVPLSFADWLPIFGFGLINVGLVEIVKAFFISNPMQNKENLI